MPTIITPTVGRKVWYYPGGEQQLKHDQPNDATIARVHSDRLINIGYRDANGESGNASSVPLVQEGDEFPHGPFCMWMPFQQGQARAQAQP